MRTNDTNIIALKELNMKKEAAVVDDSRSSTSNNPRVHNLGSETLFPLASEG